METENFVIRNKNPFYIFFFVMAFPKKFFVVFFSRSAFTIRVPDVTFLTWSSSHSFYLFLVFTIQNGYYGILDKYYTLHVMLILYDI